jgi:hypothetical protein
LKAKVDPPNTSLKIIPPQRAESD